MFVGSKALARTFFVYALGACAAGACATRPATTDDLLSRVPPRISKTPQFLSAVEDGFRYAMQEYGGAAAIDVTRVWIDVLARMRAAFPRAGVMRSGHALTAPNGRLVALAPPADLGELRDKVFDLVRVYRAAGPGDGVFDERRNPERLAMVALFCNMDPRTVLVPPAVAYMVLPAQLQTPALRRAALLEPEPPVEVLCVRPRLSAPPRAVTTADGNVDGVMTVALHHLREGAAADLDARLVRVAAQSEKRRGIVLDLRGCPGGVLNEADKVLDLFLPEGVSYHVLGFYNFNRRQGHGVYSTTTSTTDWTLPMVLLVDGATASGCEIVGAVLSERADALVVGSMTAGLGTTQLIYRFPESFGMLQLTTAHIQTASKRELDGVGVDLDVCVGKQGNDSGKCKVITPELDDSALLRFATNILRTSKASDRESLRDAAARLAPLLRQSGPGGI